MIPNGRQRVSTAVLALLVAAAMVAFTAGSASAGDKPGYDKPGSDKPGYEEPGDHKPVGPTDPGSDFILTILHNNDGESSLLPLVDDDTGIEYGGVARFQGKVDDLRHHAKHRGGPAERPTRGVVLLNSGDNYLPGPNFQASEQDGAPFYDAIAVRLLQYDALGIGNHEFDFGPETFRRFIDNVDPWTPFVSANLDYSNEPALADEAGESLVASAVIHEQGHRIGIVGLTTPALPTISSPGGVEVSAELVAIAQAEIDALTGMGIDKIVFISHLQGLDSELELAAELRDVDVVIGGGGDEILADESDELFPGHEDDIFGDYPQVARDLDGDEVPVVTTPGNYRYVGALEITFDAEGEVVGWDEDYSGIKLVTDTGPEAVSANKQQRSLVEEPVAAFVAELAETIIGTSEVALDCERTEVRGTETNCGNLIVDAHLATGVAQAPDFGLPTPQLAIMNGGGIRGEIDQPVGPISVADTFRMAPFGNLVAIAEDVPAETVRQIIEEGAIRLPESGDGGFVHVSDGTTLVIDSSFPARVADQSTGEQTVPGERVRTLILADGTVVVEDGVTQDGVTVDLVGLNFSLGGGDAYPEVPFTAVGVSDQQSLQTYIEDTLGGTVSAGDYPPGGEGRLTIR
ncbi:MAG: bifunctional metallophosphatase/5'-nucleotidase [Acidimicrobiales bacterium]